MAQKPIVMEQIKRILQLKNDGVSIREISRRVGMSRNSVRKYLSKLIDVWQVADRDLADKAYHNEAILHQNSRFHQLIQYFKNTGDELKRTGVTRQLLWNEYLQLHPDGYAYSQYCHHLAGWLKQSDVAMHMEYAPGDLMMIDFAGKKQSYVDKDTGEVIECEVFIAVLPFSGLSFCCAVRSQKTSDVAEAINRMLRFNEGSARTILCDNFKAAVIKADRYEPVFTELCHQLSEHYGTTFSATRPYSPRDKAMVEKLVNIIYNHVYGPLRHQSFNSLEALNEAMQIQLHLLNEKSYKHTPYSRRYFFEQDEKATLKVLPSEPFGVKKVTTLTVQRNYHIQLTEDRHYYSVPYQYVGKKVQVYYDRKVVEVYCCYERIAFHPRNTHAKMYHTILEHMPPNHQQMKRIKGWNKEDLLNQARQLGTAVEQTAMLILDSNFLVEQNYKSCFGLLMLKNKYDVARLNAACNRALQGTRVNYTMIKNILERGLDKSNAADESMPTPPHENIRGKENYQ